MTYYTPEQFILASVGRYPTLYAGSSYNDTRLRVLDHTLNTIGNGKSKKDYRFKEYDFESARKYISEEKLFYGYKEEDCTVSTFSNGDKWIKPNSSAGSVIDCIDSERINHPEIFYWIESRRHEYIPYPNFKKEYSSVYEPFFVKLGPEWINEAIWFYEQSLEYFNSSNCKSYSYAFPSYDPHMKKDTTEHKIKQFNNHVSGKTNAEITHDYGLEYTGDTYDFLYRRWSQERDRIIEFINETIEMLKNNI